MQKNKKDILLLHIAVMLFGLSGVIGQFVEVPAVMVTWGRVVASSVLLLILSLASQSPLQLKCKKDYMVVVLTGIVLAVHWTSFFQSIQVSSVAIGTITFSTFPLFLTLMEPLVFHEQIRLKNIVGAVVLLIGVIITIPEFSMENQVTMGIFWGMISSFTYAVMTLSNRYLARNYAGRTICLYEQATVALVLLPALFVVDVKWRTQDVIGVAFIGFICTAFAHSLYVSAQKGVKAQTAGMISGMETVYGIFYAFLFLGEIPAVREITGGIIILGVGLLFSFL